MTTAIALECPVCAGTVDSTPDLLLGELLDCDDCGSELEVTQIAPAVQIAVAPMAAEDRGE